MEVFGRETRSVAQARVCLRRFLREHGIDTQLYDDATLIVSELVTNALRYGGGSTVLRATITDHAVHIAVSDSGGGVPEVREGPADRGGGLGLVVVNKLSTDWGVAPFPGGKTVWASLRRAQKRRANQTPSD